MSQIVLPIRTIYLNCTDIDTIKLLQTRRLSIFVCHPNAGLNAIFDAILSITNTLPESN